MNFQDFSVHQIFQNYGVPNVPIISHESSEGLLNEQNIYMFAQDVVIPITSKISPILRYIWEHFIDSEDF